VEGVINCSYHIWKKTANHKLSALDVHILHFVDLLYGIIRWNYMSEAGNCISDDKHTRVLISP
jgi:hypothetical protein